MTKKEFYKKIKQITNNFSSEQKEKSRELLYSNYMAWTHCNACGRSNQRLNCWSNEEYEELKNNCKEDNWKCFFCDQPLVVYCGCNNGEVTSLPSYSELLEKIKKEDN